MLKKKPTICICGGGSLGHVIAGVAASKGFQVNLLTRKPEAWSKTLMVHDLEGKTFQGELSCISSHPEEVVPSAQIVLLCLPGYAIKDELIKIRPHLSADSCVGSVVCCTGFFFAAYQVLGKNCSLFGFQRAPFIARTQVYGQEANLLGYKKELQVAVYQHKNPEVLVNCLEEMLQTPVRLLHHFLEASLTNSNPILHPARLYALFQPWLEGKVFEENPGFYSTWDRKSSELLIACDEEFQRTLQAIPVKISPVPTLLDYYDSWDADSLTQKLRSIPAFKSIGSPMVRTEKGYEPDFNSRYFQEDFPFGLLIIKSIAEALGVKTPQIDRIICWGQEMIHKEYLTKDGLNGKDLKQSGYVSPELLQQLIHD